MCQEKKIIATRQSAERISPEEEHTNNSSNSSTMWSRVPVDVNKRDQVDVIPAAARCILSVRAGGLGGAGNRIRFTIKTRIFLCLLGTRTRKNHAVEGGNDLTRIRMQTVQARGGWLPVTSSMGQRVKVASSRLALGDARGAARSLTFFGRLPVLRAAFFSACISTTGIALVDKHGASRHVSQAPVSKTTVAPTTTRTTAATAAATQRGGPSGYLKDEIK